MGWFYVITQEMIEWGLTGSELLVFALVNGYSQKGQGCYWGSLETTAEICGISRATAVRTLQALTEKGYITKTKAVVNDELHTIYIATRVSKCDHGLKMRPQSQNETSSSLKMRPNNIDDNIKKKDTIREGKFNFKSALMQIGVSKEVADAWIQVRKTKRATNTEIAFRAICEEIKKSGLSADECITIAVQQSWQGFKASWVEDRRSRTTSRPQPQKKESAFEQNMRAMDLMFGTNYHEQMYGEKEVTDEQ